MTGGVEIPDLVSTKRRLEEKSAESRSKRHRPAADNVHNNSNIELDVLGVNTLSLRQPVSSVFEGEILNERPCAAHSTGDVVCYGMLSKVKCQQFRTVASGDLQIAQPYTEFSIEHSDGRFLLSLANGYKFAYVNCKAAKAFSQIWTTDDATVTAYVGQRYAMERLKGKSESTQLPCVHEIHFNIYGPRSFSKVIGRCLSDQQLFLQPPFWESRETTYLNPHILEFPSLSGEDVNANGEQDAPDSLKLRGPENAWSPILDNLSEHSATTQGPDVALLSVSLLAYALSSIIPLLLSQLTCVNASHQLVAYDFMTQRESIDQDKDRFKFWEPDDSDGVHVYRHKVTGTERYEQPFEPRGGVLADEMGLGKTLSTLCVIVSSLERSREFASQGREKAVPTKTTLVVAPSLLLLEDWVKEIQSRILPGTVRVTVYHGHQRSRCVANINDFDIVLTTYGTITTEYRKNPNKSPLFNLHWFRIVLDEAHTIRSRNTKQFEAIMSLEALHYWCLTATPIVNKVDDLGALLQFCRVPILGEHKHFRETITKTSKLSFRRCCALLRQTLSPICLRRTKQSLKLTVPLPVYTVRKVNLSAAERTKYQQILQCSKSAIDENVSNFSSATKRLTVLQVILQLRRLCNHGTILPQRSGKVQDGMDADELLTLRQEEENAICVSCQSSVTLINQPADAASAFMGTCDHLVCAACVDACSWDPTTGSINCPQCQRMIFRKSQPIISTEDVHKNRCLGGHSSKLELLITDLLTTQSTDKSLVFSVWQATTNIISQLCSEAGIHHVCIDGSAPQMQRSHAIKSFREDPSTSVLIMTLGTGALGLNLTAATRIHIIEPQWNPAVEEQAIGRAVRLGQDRQTTVVRYVVNDSVEEQIQGYQKRKVQLAAGGFDENSEEQIEAHTKLLTATFLREQISTAGATTESVATS